MLYTLILQELATSAKDLWFLCTLFLELEFGNVSFYVEMCKLEYPEKNPRIKIRRNNKLEPHINNYYDASPAAHCQNVPAAGNNFATCSHLLLILLLTLLQEIFETP